MNRIEEDIIEEVSKEKDKKDRHNGFLITLVALIMVLLIVMMIIPYSSIRANPEPKNIPGIDTIDNIKFSQEKGGPLSMANSLTEPTPSVKLLADIISTRSCKYGGEMCFAKANYYFVRDNIKYIKDPVTSEYVKHPHETLLSRAGDCDDHAVLLASMLKSIGIPVNLIVTKNHMLIEAYMSYGLLDNGNKGKWIYLDPTCKDCEFGELPVEVMNDDKRVLG